jgi:hypothetical protein
MIHSSKEESPDMKRRSIFSAISAFAVAGALASSACPAFAAEKYANQEVSVAKPASQPSTVSVQPAQNTPSGQPTANQYENMFVVEMIKAPDPDRTTIEQVQPPGDAASNPAAGFTSADGRSMSFELVKDSSGQPRQLGDSGTHEFGHRSARQDIEVENDETHVAIPRTETVGNNETAAVGGSGGASAQAFTGYLKIEGVVAQPVEGEAGQTAGAGASGKDRDALMADTLEEVRTKKTRRNRNGARGKRQHKP